MLWHDDLIIPLGSLFFHIESIVPSYQSDAAIGGNSEHHPPINGNTLKDRIPEYRSL